jgi:hypothetical protein
MIQNGGFESGDGWTLQYQASIEAAAALFGTAGLQMFATDLLNPPSASQTVEFGPGDYTLEFYAKADNPLTSEMYVQLTSVLGTGSCKITVDYNGDWTSEAPIGNVVSTGNVTVTDWNKFSVPVTLTGTADRAVVVATPSPNGQRWWVDALKVTEGAMFTETIHAAIVSDLGDIDGTGIFTTTLAEATGDQARRFDEMKHPAAIVFNGEGADDPETLGNKTREATQTYTIRLGIQSNTPQAGIRALLDDVRNSLQRSTGNTLTATASNNKVHDVTCTWTLPEADEGVHEGILTATIDVAVTYYYDSGGL